MWEAGFMQATSTQRADAIFRALLPDGHARERDELLASGVSEGQIISLYPYDLSAVNDGMEAYVCAGKRIALRHTPAVHQSIAAKAFPLYALLPYSEMTKNAKSFDNRWEVNERTTQAIVNHHAVTFSETEGFASFSGTHAEQAESLIARLIVGLLYAQQLDAASGANDYLGLLVDTYIPDLLAEHALG
jgi:hypothetical protein